MRAKTLLAVGVLGFGGSLVSVPVATAAVPTEDAIVSLDPAAARPICRGTLGATFHTTSCIKAAPGSQFRAGIDCTNSGWRYGPWRNQTTDYSTKSTVHCLTGGTAQNYRIQFR